jgi:CheY-like chemotaxis protein
MTLPSPDQKLTVLVIDDDSGVRDVLEEFLVQLGYDTIAAPDGAAGLAKLLKQPPDAVLLDIAMPGALGGLETLGVIKRAWPDVPVIMVTANVDEKIAKATLREGAVDYLMKPLDMGRLREVLATALLLSGKTPPA